MGYLEKYRIFVPELRRSLHIAKYRNEQKSARFHIVTYIIWANAQLLDFQSKSNLERVSIFNTSQRSSSPLIFLPYLMGTVSVLKTDIKKCDSTALTTYFYIVRAVLSLNFKTIYRKNTK